MSEFLSSQSQTVLTPETVFFAPIRQIGFVIPDCTIEERHTDRLQITQHPVELGAQISDHAFLLPFEVSVRYGFSDGFFTPGSWRQAYDSLQKLQQSRNPFDLMTGKRIYKNMLLTEMEVTSDQHTENVLMVEAHCQAVIIVSTSTVPAAASADQSLASQTGGQASVGQQQLVDTNTTPPITGLTTGLA